jgi:hypothetical protein
MITLRLQPYENMPYSRPNSDTLEVKAIVPFGQAAVIGVVPGAWVTGIGAVGDEPTPVHTMAEYVELVDSFLGKGTYRSYIRTVRVGNNVLVYLILPLDLLFPPCPAISQSVALVTPMRLIYPLRYILFSSSASILISNETCFVIRTV